MEEARMRVTGIGLGLLGFLIIAVYQMQTSTMFGNDPSQIDLVLAITSNLGIVPQPESTVPFIGGVINGAATLANWTLAAFVGIPSLLDTIAFGPNWIEHIEEEAGSLFLENIIRFVYHAAQAAIIVGTILFIRGNSS